MSRRDQRLDELRLRLEAACGAAAVRMLAQRHAVLAERLRRRELTARIAGMQRRLQDLDQSLRVSATGMLAVRRVAFEPGFVPVLKRFRRLLCCRAAMLLSMQRTAHCCGLQRRLQQAR